MFLDIFNYTHTHRQTHVYIHTYINIYIYTYNITLYINVSENHFFSIFSNHKNELNSNITIKQIGQTRCNRFKNTNKYTHTHNVSTSKTSKTTVYPFHNTTC